MEGEQLTCGGPRIVPFQFDMRRSSPSERPYEHASEGCSMENGGLRGVERRHTGSETFLTFLEFLQKAEVAGNLRSHP